MQIKGTIRQFRRLSNVFYLETEQGEYRIHFSQRERLGLGEKCVGLKATGETADDIYPPEGWSGYVKNGSLIIEQTSEIETAP